MTDSPGRDMAHLRDPRATLAETERPAPRDRLIRRVILVAMACLGIAILGMLALGVALVRT